MAGDFLAKGGLFLIIILPDEGLAKLTFSGALGVFFRESGVGDDTAQAEV